MLAVYSLPSISILWRMSVIKSAVKCGHLRSNIYSYIANKRSNSISYSLFRLKQKPRVYTINDTYLNKSTCPLCLMKAWFKMGRVYAKKFLCVHLREFSRGTLWSTFFNSLEVFRKFFENLQPLSGHYIIRINILQYLVDDIYQAIHLHNRKRPW